MNFRNVVIWLFLVMTVGCLFFSSEKAMAVSETSIFFSTAYIEENFTTSTGIAQYFSFMFNIVLPMSILFELPIVVMFLTKIRVLNPQRLQKMRRVAYLLLIIIATMVTPPDLISDILVSVPLILLYEFSIFLSRLVYRKQLELVNISGTEEYA
jgi:sec-independent protein translocase protein TatC